MIEWGGKIHLELCKHLNDANNNSHDDDDNENNKSIHQKMPQK